MSSDRRAFINRLKKITAASALVAAAPASMAAGDGGGRGPGPARHSFVMSADTEKQCATCAFWGGQRHLSKDRKSVHATTLGVCNNPASVNYRRTTSPNTGPMEAWVKWPALDV